MSRQPTSFSKARVNPISRSSNRLRDWKKNGSIVVWVHTASGHTARLIHRFPYLFIDDETKKKTVRWINFVCHEEPELYYNQNTPNETCPIERLVDFLANDGRIPDNEPVYSVSIGDPQKDRLYTKVDFIGEGDWRLSAKPKLEYVTAVIDDENPSNGIVIASFPQSLGEQIPRVINDQIDSEGEERGDPEIEPYAFKLTFDKSARKPADYYSAYAYRRATLTDEIQKLLDTPQVDISRWINPGDSEQLLKIFKRHFVLDLEEYGVSLEDFFDRASLDQVRNEEEEEEATPVESVTKKKPPTKTNKKSKPAIKDVIEVDTSEKCETCNGVGTLGKKKITCPDCGGTGKAEPDEVEPEQSKDTDEIEFCELCGGSGTIGKKKLECPECGGSGLANTVAQLLSISGNLQLAVDSSEEPEEKPAKPAKKKSQKKAEAKQAEIPEEEMSMCAECNSVIPSSAKSCPNCGAIFPDDDDTEDD